MAKNKKSKLTTRQGGRSNLQPIDTMVRVGATSEPKLDLPRVAPAITTAKTQLKKGTWEVWRMDVDPQTNQTIATVPLAIVTVDLTGAETWQTVSPLPLPILPAPSFLYFTMRDPNNVFPPLPNQVVVRGPRLTTFELTSGDDDLSDQEILAGGNGYALDMWNQAAARWGDRAWVAVAPEGTLHILAPWSIDIPLQPPFAVTHAAAGVWGLPDMFRVVVETSTHD